MASETLSRGGLVRVGYWMGGFHEDVFAGCRYRTVVCCRVTNSSCNNNETALVSSSSIEILLVSLVRHSRSSRLDSFPLRRRW
jgi:hypothetical protein